MGAFILNAINAILEASPIPTFVLNKNNEIVYWNRACEIVTGILAKEVVGTTDAWKGFYPAKRPVMANLVLEQNIDAAMLLYSGSECLKSKTIPMAYEAEGFFPHMSSGAKWLHFTASPIFNESKELIGVMETLQDITEQKIAEEKIKKLAYYDNLTSLPNRTLFFDQVKHALSRADRNKTLLVMAYMDLDGFKQINDTYGHAAGDQVLVEVSRKSLKTLRAYDTIARFGGDEFAICLSDITSKEEGIHILSRLIEVIQEPMNIFGVEMQVSASIGCAVYPSSEVFEADSLLRYADHAMYHAKKSGKNQIQVFEEKYLEIEYQI